MELVQPSITVCDSIYSFVLDKYHVMTATDEHCFVTLGHNFIGDIREHRQPGIVLARTNPRAAVTGFATFIEF